MAEILIMMRDVKHEDVVLDSKMPKRGDVVSVLPDGSDWGDMTMTHDFFRVIRFTDVSVSEASVLTAPEVESNPGHPNPMLRSRMHSFNLNHPNLPAQVKAFLAAGVGSNIFVVPEVLSRRLLSDRIVKPPIPNPNVIG